MHAFGMSERYLILAEYPLRVNPLKLAFSGRPFIENYTWRADEPTRFQVFDRASGELRGTYETDAFFCFHHVNAFERGGELVIDLCAYEDSSIIDSLYLDDERPARRDPAGRAAPLHDRPGRRRGALGAARRRARSSCRGSTTGAATRATTRTRTSPGADTGWIDRLVKVDVRDGSRSEWRADGCYPGEPVFVREPGRRGRGRRRRAVGGARHERRPLVPAGARRAAPSRRSPAPRRRTTSRSASTGSTSDERAARIRRGPRPHGRAAARGRAEGRLTSDELEERLETRVLRPHRGRARAAGGGPAAPPAAPRAAQAGPQHVRAYVARAPDARRASGR